MSDGAGLRLYVYTVKLCQEDGTVGSGWSVTVATTTQDPAAILRTAQVYLATGESPRAGSPEKWTGIDEIKLLTTAVLDPQVAA